MKTMVKGLGAAAFAAMLILTFAACGDAGGSSGNDYEVIDIAAIQGVTVPVTGRTPVTVITPTAQYTGTVAWNGNPSTFAAEIEYTATIRLTPQSGYTLQGVTADFFRVAGAESVSNAANSGVITAMFPATAQGNTGNISIAAIQGVTAPVTGRTPVTVITPTAQYTGTVTWEPNDWTFAAATQYTATITLSPINDYTLQGIAADFFTVEGAESVNNAANSGVITAVFPKTNATVISSVIINITAPVKDTSPGTTASGTGDFTIGGVSWSPYNNPFLGDTVYTASVTLTADSGYTFTGLSSAVINGQSAVVSDNLGDTVKLSYTFPATDARTVIGIVIKTQPDKLTYTHDDPLNLTGLVVTLLYEDGTTGDVAAADFTAKNITANPAQGIHLVHSEHDGQYVTITYGSFTQTTNNNLSVSKGIGSFSNPAAIDTTYTSTLTLGDLTLPPGYAFNAPTTKLNAGNNQSFAAAYINPNGNYEAASGNITVNVAKASGAEFSAPALNAKTHNSITINAISASTGQTVEYARNTVNNAPSSGWQTGTTFNGLSPVTTYYIFARSMSNDNYDTGTASGSLSVETLQAVSPDKVEYYWVDQHGSLVTTSGGAVTAVPGAALTITAASTGYVVKQWHLNGADTSQSGNTYNFSGATPGKYIVGLFVEKDGNLYNTNITITVASTGGTVTYNINSGSGTTPSSQTAAANTSVTLPAGSGFSRSGYTFGGWNTNNSGTGTNYDAGASYYPSGNITLYARWIQNVNVTYSINGGTGTTPASQSVLPNTVITLPSGSGFSRGDYTFGGWNTNSSGTGTNYNAGSSYSSSSGGSITLYARWTATVTYDLNGGTGTVPASQTVNAGSSITLSNGNGITKSGFIFWGWYTTASGVEGTDYYKGETCTPTGNITLYARWLTGITVTYDLNGGTGTAPQPQTINNPDASLSLPSESNFSKTGYAFEGWHPLNDSIYPLYLPTGRFTPTQDLTIYAVWTLLVPLTANTWSGNSLYNNADQQWFTFTATAATQYIHVQFTGGSLSTLYISVLDSADNIVGTNSTLNSNTRNTSRSLSVGQVYKIKVTGNTGNNSGSFNIAFNASSTSP